MENLALFLFYVLSLIVISVLCFNAGKDYQQRIINEKYQECVVEFDNHEKCYSLIMKEQK